MVIYLNTYKYKIEWELYKMELKFEAIELREGALYFINTMGKTWLSNENNKMHRNTPCGKLWLDGTIHQGCDSVYCM